MEEVAGFYARFCWPVDPSDVERTFMHWLNRPDRYVLTRTAGLDIRNRLVRMPSNTCLDGFEFRDDGFFFDADGSACVLVGRSSSVIFGTPSMRVSPHWVNYLRRPDAEEAHLAKTNRPNSVNGLAVGVLGLPRRPLLLAWVGGV